MTTPNDLLRQMSTMLAQAIIAANESDLASDGIGPGCRPLGKVENPKPLIPHDQKPSPQK